LVAFSGWVWSFLEKLNAQNKYRYVFFSMFSCI
jgi:hypothetical protein